MDKKRIWLRRLPIILGSVLAILFAVGVYVLQSQFEKPVQIKKQVQQITVIQPPPPPPPPPEQKPPEPEPEEKIPEPKPEPEPEPTPEESQEPAGEELGVDAEGGAGTDGFGLVGKKGGRGLLGGNGGSSILWYGGQVKRQLSDELQTVLAGTQARSANYSVVINIWLATDGRLSKAELAGSSGMAEVDKSIREALPRLRLAIGKSPPENMPQPLKIKVTSKI